MIETSWLNIVLLLGLVQGLFMAYLLWQKKWSNAPAVRYLVYLLLLISALMIGRIAITIPAISNWGALVLLPDVILFLIGPMCYFFMRSLLRQGLDPKPKIYWHFLPAGIHIFILSTLVALHIEDVLSIMSQKQIIQLFFFIEGAAIISISAYLFLSMNYFRAYKVKFYEKYSAPFIGEFLRLFFISTCGVLLFWTVGFINNFFLPQPNYNVYILVWFSLVFMTYLLAGKILMSPQLLELPPLKQKDKEEANPVISKEVLSSLEQHMAQQKPHLNPELKIADLANALDLPQHELSRIINQGYQKNFFDFINTYRVQEFIILRQSSRNAHLNTLNLAFQSGFNSKSAFNRAFRKITNESPRNYFKEQLAMLNQAGE